ncbi:hypothetical protein [Arthrobacter sp. MYb227]|uniref:hypothetical protein n=1 Tax=Arthrobacter sp. MYb227 TaxID=1848601 RepID=UPI0011B082EB|nr:hypothetical protein [Arthrobacter sp. MYb227]
MTETRGGSPQMGIENLISSDHLARISGEAQRNAEAAMRHTEEMAKAAQLAQRVRQRQAAEDEAVERAQAERVAQTKLLSALSALSEEQAQTMAAMNKASREQVQTLAAMRKLSEDLEGERRRSKYLEEKQAKFNKGMTILASVLAGGAVIVPFIVLYLDKVL